MSKISPETINSIFGDVQTILQINTELLGDLQQGQAMNKHSMHAMTDKMHQCTHAYTSKERKRTSHPPNLGMQQRIANLTEIETTTSVTNPRLGRDEPAYTPDPCLS